MNHSFLNELTHRGARVLEDAIGQQVVSLVDAAVYEKLANCWIARQFERAVAPLQRVNEPSRSRVSGSRVGYPASPWRL